MKNAKTYGLEVLYIVLGSIIYALSVVLFIDPVNIIPGSVTGIGVITKALFGIPIGVLNVIINVPLVLVGVFYLGKKLLVYTALTIVLTSVMMDWWAFLPPFTEDFMLASIFGGLLMGFGMGLLLRAGATTGGTTVIGRLITRKHPNIPIGNILLVVDFIIIMVGSVLLQNWDLLLYSLVNLYICVVAINKVVYGLNIKSLSLIFTHRANEVKAQLSPAVCPRAVPLSGSEALVCVGDKRDLNKLQRAVEAADPSAYCASLDLDYSFGNENDG